MTIHLRANNSILLPYKPKKLAIGETDYMEAIPNNHMKTVVFLCVDESIMGSTKRIPKATGFFVRVPIEGSNDLYVDYIVTARHCIEEARQYGVVYVRGNRKLGGFIEFPTKVDDWYIHDNADVAIINILWNMLPKDTQPQDLDLVSIPHNSFVGGSPDYKIFVPTVSGEQEVQPRVGHQVYMIGLFTEHYGKERNLPIARFGHIARMPDSLDICVHDTHLSIVAYLIEFYSWGGHSGSPVFFMIPVVEQDAMGGMLMRVHLSWKTGLLGLVSGHYEIKKDAETTGGYGEVQFALNSGIAYVTPAEAITQLLIMEDLVKKRNELKSLVDSHKPLTTLDTQETYTKSDFLLDLKKVSQKKSEKSDQEQS
jgi:hypothetical protein